MMETFIILGLFLSTLTASKIIILTMKYHGNFFIIFFSLFFVLMLAQIFLEITLLGDKVYIYIILIYIQKI